MPASDLFALADSSPATKPRMYRPASSRAATYSGWVGTVACAIRVGLTHSAFLWRSYDDDLFVVGGADLVAELIGLHSTVEVDA